MAMGVLQVVWVDSRRVRVDDLMTMKVEVQSFPYKIILILY